MEFPFKSTKTWHQAFPVAYRQWKADSHCRILHGYALTIHLEFGCLELDARNWAVDFGGLRGLKGQLEDWFDHTTLVAVDDPEIELLRELGRRKVAKITEVERTGCEGLADFIFEHLNDGWLSINGYADRVICTKVEVRETDSNMAFRELTTKDYLRFTQASLDRLPKLPSDFQYNQQPNGILSIEKAGSTKATISLHAAPGYTSSHSEGRYLRQHEAVLAELEYLRPTPNKDKK